MLSFVFMLMFPSEIGKVDICKHMSEEHNKFVSQNTFNHYEIGEDVYAIINGKKMYSVHSAKEYIFDQENKRVYIKETDSPVSDSAPVGGVISSKSKLVIFNERYKAGLLKKNDTVSWAMTLLQKDVAPDRSAYLRISDGKNMPWCCYMSGIGIGTLLNKEYEFTSYNEEMKDGLLIVKATAKTKLAKPLFDSFVFWINPSKGWRLEKYEIHKSWGKNYEEKGVAYGVKTFNEKNPLIMINEIVEYKNPKFKDSLFKEFRINYTADAVDSNVFFLTNYNIPEPNTVEKYDYSVYYYTGFTILIIVGLFLIVRSFKKENQ